MIRPVVVGDLAVGANGHPRATKHVDFLVGAEAFEHHGKLVTLRAGLPFQVDGVAVDFRSPEADEPFLEAELAAAPGEVIGPAALVYLKVKAVLPTKARAFRTLRARSRFRPGRR